MTTTNTTPTPTPGTDGKSGPGCLAFSLFLLGMVAAVGIAIYIMMLLGGPATN